MRRRLRAIWSRLGSAVDRSRRERDLAAELESHLQLHIDDNVRAGMTPAEARRQARLALGGVEQTMELVREERATWGEVACREIACALRQAHRRRWHVAAIAVMLAAGIGGSTAVFSFLYQVLLQPTGIEAPSRLVELYQTTPPSLASRGVTRSDGFPFAGMREQREQNPAFSGIGMAVGEYVALVADGHEAQRLNAAFVSDGYFDTLGVRLRMGRGLPRADEAARESVAIISDRLWDRAFDRDSDVLGRVLRLNGHPCRIVGVAPAGFMGTGWPIASMCGCRGRAGRHWGCRRRAWGSPWRDSRTTSSRPRQRVWRRRSATATVPPCRPATGIVPVSIGCGPSR